MVFLLCARVCPNSLFLKGHQSQGLRTYPCNSILPHLFFTLWSYGGFASNVCTEVKQGHRSNQSNVVSGLQVCLRVKKTWTRDLRPEPLASHETPLEVAIQAGLCWDQCIMTLRRTLWETAFWKLSELEKDYLGHLHIPTVQVYDSRL